MDLYKRGETWWCRVGGKRRSTGCKDKRAAEARARQFEREAADPHGHARAAATLHDALDLLILDRQGKAKAGRGSSETTAFYQRKCATLLWRLGDRDGKAFEVEGAKDRLLVSSPLRLVDVSAALVDDYITKRRSEEIEDSTIAKELTAWRAAMRLAKRRGLYAGDLSEVFPIAFSPAYKPRERWMTPAEWLALVADADALDQPESRRAETKRARVAILAIVAFSVATSAEWSAITRARPEDVDLDAWTVHVRGTKDAHKGGNRDRVVPVVHLGHAYLLAFAAAHADGGGVLLFRAKSNFRRDLAAACARAGIPRLSPNDLRRSHAQWLRRAGVRPAELAPVMGHADSRMVERVYGRVKPTELAALLSASVNGRSLITPAAVSPRAPTPIAASAAVPDLYRTGVEVGIPGRSSHASEAANAAVFVPRDGIEPPTRGFSSDGEGKERPEKPSFAGATVPDLYRPASADAPAPPAATAADLVRGALKAAVDGGDLAMAGALLDVLRGAGAPATESKETGRGATVTELASRRRG